MAGADQELLGGSPPAVWTQDPNLERTIAALTDRLVQTAVNERAAQATIAQLNAEVRNVRYFYEAERWYRDIRGTQLALLVFLNGRRATGGTPDEVSTYYARFVAAGVPMVGPADSPRPLVSFGEWFGFLESRSLVAYDPVGARYLITQQGTWFLGYLLRNQISLEKPF